MTQEQTLLSSLTNEHRENLNTLATYLESLPEDYSHFDMGDYFIHNECLIYQPSYATRIIQDCECGTVACAIGHGILAGIPATLEENWYDYGLRAFGVSIEDELGKFMFSGVWNVLDNTAHGAAKRIRYILSLPNDADIPDVGDLSYQTWEPA